MTAPQPAPELRSAEPQPAPLPAPQPNAAPVPAPQPNAAPIPAPQPNLAPLPAPQAPRRPLQLRPQGPPQPQPQLRSADAEIIESDVSPAPAAPQQPQPVAPPQPQPSQGPRARLAIPNMPIQLQQRLLELLTAQGGSVTEVFGENGQSASVVDAADALQDVNLQGGERVTTRRIVVTRPIETIQEVSCLFTNSFN